MLAREPGEDFVLTPEQESFLTESAEQARRREVISGDEMLRRLAPQTQDLVCGFDHLGHLDVSPLPEKARRLFQSGRHSRAREKEPRLVVLRLPESTHAFLPESPDSETSQPGPTRADRSGPSEGRRAVKGSDTPRSFPDRLGRIEFTCVTDGSFFSGCSPPFLAETQLPLSTSGR